MRHSPQRLASNVAQETAPRLLLASIFALAGWVKGAVGLGRPTVAMSGLGLFVPPLQAAVGPFMVARAWGGPGAGLGRAWGGHGS